jgi:PAS domain S-box-containing protein
LANLATGVTVATAGGIATGNTLEAVSAAFLLHRFVGARVPFYRGADAVKFVVIAGALSPAVSATIGNLSLCLGGAAQWSNFGPLWLTWWLGDGVGALVVAPLLLTWIEKSPERWSPSRRFEAALMLAVLSGVVISASAGWPSAKIVNYGLSRLIFPLLLWAAFRLGPRGVSVAMAMSSAIAIGGTRQGFFPYVLNNPNDSLMFLQVFVASIAVTAMVLAAVVAERKRAEQTASFLASIVESTDDAVIGRSLDGTILSWNKGAERLYGYAAEEAIGRHLSMLVPAHRTGELSRMVEQLKRGEHVDRFETERVRKDGQTIVVALTLSPIKDSDGKIIGGSVIARDVTEHKKAEKALSESKARLAGMIDVAMDAIITINDEQHIVIFNAAAEKMFGCSSEQAIGQSIGRFIPDRFRHAHGQHVRDFGQTGVTRRSMGRLGDIFGLRANGEEFPIEASISQLATNGQQLYTVILRDITQRKEAERRLAGNLAVTAILAESPALGDAMPRVLQRICESLDWEFGAMWTPDFEANVLRCLKVWHGGSAPAGKFAATCYERTFVPGVGLPGRVWTGLKPAWIPDVTKDANFPRAAVAAAEGLHGAFAFPILSGEQFLGVMEFFSHEIREPDDAMLAMFNGIGSQIGQFVQRKRTEEALLKNQEALRLAHKVARGGTWQWDLVTNAVEWSQEYYDLLGLDPDATPPSFEEWSNRVHPDDLPAVLKEHEVAIGSRRDVDIEFRIRRADGQWRWFNRTARCIYDVGGQPQSMIGITFDITERKKAKEAARQNEERIRLIVDAALDAVITIDRGGYITDWNPEAERVFGWTKTETIGKKLSETVIPLRFRQAHERGMQTYWATGKGPLLNKRLEITAAHRDGREIDVELAITPVVVGDQIYFSSFIRDITERKQAEQERELLLAREQQARAEAEAANRLKDEFLATVSHELRTPLTSMLGWAQLLRGRLNEPAAERGLQTIERNAKAQVQLIEDLLDVSRIITGKLRLNVRPVQLTEVIYAVIDLMRPAATAKGVRLESSLDPTASLISGDPERLQQIVWNLLSNAIRFTPRGGRVDIRLDRNQTDAQVVVSDNGDGIGPEFLPYVFDRFRQADSSRTRRHGGLGLGLSLVRQLVELHGGTATAYSAGEGQGSSFTITLPLLDAHLDNAERKVMDPLANGAILEGVWVLAVDDEADTRELLEAALGQFGARVTAVDSVTGALEVLAGNARTPDVLLSDIGMPGEDGYDLIRKVRELGQQRGFRTPAIALTGYARDEERARALEEGYQVYLSKPVETIALVAVITELASREVKGADF